jgi:hypothetical protein
MEQKYTVPRRPPLQVVMGPEGQFHVGPGGHIRVHVVSVDFAASVIDDFCRIAALPEGAALLAACDALGRTIDVTRPEAPIEPPNGTIQPEDRPAATARGAATGQESATGDPVLGTGEGSGSLICYDPAEWPWQGDPASPTGARVLLALLRQARINAEGADDPTDGRTCPVDGG